MDNVKPKSVISLKSLSLSLTLLLLSILLTSGSIVGVLHLNDQNQRAFQQVRNQQSETRARLARADDDEREIREKIARYQDLVAQGRTLPERRLEWVETLRGIKESRRLLGLDYEIAPQRPLNVKAPSAGGHDFLVSTMKLDLPLLHENDLLGLLADLSAQVQALVSVQKCSIERLPFDPSRQNPAILKATCEVEWITLREK